MFGGKKRNQDILSGGENKTSLEELTHLFDRLENIISDTKDAHIRSIQSQAEEDAKPKRTRLVSSFKNFGRKSEVTPGAADAEINSMKSPRSITKKEDDARFIPMPDEDVKNVVEIIRRISELVILAERAPISVSDDATEKNIAVFDCFFERNGLALISDILTGVSFDLRIHTEKQRNALKLTESPRSDDLLVAEGLLQGFDVEEHNYMLLPPLAIATQAIQSVSILVQNVTRVTSLFFILSNNHINQLVNFPLEQYHIAERKKHNQEGNGMSPRRFDSPELAELTTHFITFLKSLALRMNAETLQFFLTYPHDNAVSKSKPDVGLENGGSSLIGRGHQNEEDRPLDEIEGNEAFEEPEKEAEPGSAKFEKIRVEFPLYERALEFCSAHQDSFVRVTAMNICMNTLRLAAARSEEDEEPVDFSNARMVTPNGVLHNAKVLPIFERLAIAQFVCAPARVERLVSPIFTKLAHLWGMFEEQFRELDVVKVLGQGITEDAAISKGKTKTELAKVRAKRQKAAGALNDTAATVQDEMLLLEDVLNVGLTTLNEQTIEMMFATFVYPLLLQPLLLYFQRSTVPDSVLYADPIKAYSMGEGVKDPNLDAGENSIVSAPAKSAFFLLTAVFQFITNKPLLRLLFTALFHPLSPGARGETTFRVEPEVACLNANGNIFIRLDHIDDDSDMKTETDRSTYAFGNFSSGKHTPQESSISGKTNEECIFVLSPALAEILQFNGDDGALVAKSRNNPYRKAIFRCFNLCNQLSDLQPFSVFAVDAAFSIFSPKFLSEILFGVDMNSYAEKTRGSNDNANSGSVNDDRDIGGAGIGVESRLSLGGPSDLGFMGEILSAFQSCLVKATPGGDGIWNLEYDMVAAHALLCAIDNNPNAQEEAETRVVTRYNAASAFIIDIPFALEALGDEAPRPKYDIQSTPDNAMDTKRGKLLDLMFRGDAGSNSLLTHLLRLKGDSSDLFTSVACRGSYRMLCQRSCQFPSLRHEGLDGAIHGAMESTKAWASLDAYCAFLSLVTNGSHELVREAKQGGIAVKGDGTVVDTFRIGMTYAPLSNRIETPLLEEDKRGDSFVDSQPRSVVSLIGRTAFPCVCEVPPSCAPLFSEVGAKVVSQGITWQSLYLVILGWNMVLAEPERSSSGNGRVVTCCRLENLVLQKDIEDLPPSTAARRMIVSHDGQDEVPPGLFLFEETPKAREVGVFIGVEKFRSTVDIWFEDQRALDLAFSKVDRLISLAKAHRGQLIRNYLLRERDANADMET